MITLLPSKKCSDRGEKSKKHIFLLLKKYFEVVQ